MWQASCSCCCCPPTKKTPATHLHALRVERVASIFSIGGHWPYSSIWFVGVGVDGTGIQGCRRDSRGQTFSGRSHPHLFSLRSVDAPRLLQLLDSVLDSCGLGHGCWPLLLHWSAERQTQAAKQRLRRRSRQSDADGTTLCSAAWLELQVVRASQNRCEWCAIRKERLWSVRSILTKRLSE